ncbi:transport protein Trs120 or TRAPPC9 TRAPP II complex subunit-domain-containing protein [Boletus edulis]|nr:transport protein Trs120 or TRAPPC9 TRAPP II complex subunit-domain-containing protein [Boletus edulis]
MIPYAFASLAHVQILLLPVGQIPRATFDAYAAEIRTFESIRLGDIPGDAKDERARFMPSPLFPSHPTLPAHSPLSLFRPSHFNLGIIGIAVCSSSHPSSSALEQTMMNPTLASEKTLPVLAIIPNAMGNKRLYIGTLLADLCSQILGEFGHLVHTLETPLGNEYLNAQFPTHSTQSELVVSHLSTPVSNGVTRSSPGLGILHGSNAVLQRHSSLGPSTVKKRVTAVGTTSSHARLFKLYGDFFLLAGRPQDARIWYQEALNSFKTGMDPVWQASAMEGLAVISVLDSWAAGQGLASISDTKDPWMEINEQLSQAVAIYLKASVPSDAHVLRQTSLLFCVWSSKGWGPFAFASMLQPGATSYWQKVISDNSWVNLERLSAITAHGPWLLHLGLPERLVVLQEAYVLREVISCIMDLVVCGRDEDYQLRRSDVGSAGLAVRTTGLQNGDDITPTGNGSLAFRPNEKMQGNQSVLRVLTYACRALGVDVESVNVAAPPNAEEDNIDPDIIPFEAMSLAESLNSSFGWPELQVGVMREAIAAMHSILPANDQSHLYQTASRALAMIRRRGDASMIEYWAGHPIQSIAVLPLPLHRIPAEKPRSAISYKHIVPGSTNDLFLYNPRKSVNTQSKTIIVQNELAELVITLRNPFVFDLELHNSNVSAISSIMIPANSIHAVTVSATAKKPGVLTVKGCTVHAFNGAPKRFFLPVSTEAEEEHQSRRHSMMLCESGRTKYSGLDARPWDKGGKHFTHSLLPSKLKTRFLECVVVPEQPLLRLRWTSLTHAAVMLYNGEKSTIRLTLENVSALPIDFLTLSFEDSTIAPAQEALAEGQLDVFETYETEYDLIHQRAFSWNRDKEIKVIDPGQKIVVSVACFGKAKCTGATVRVSYAHARRNDESGATPEIFYTRQLTYPMTVTVYHMLECHNMNVVPLDAFSDIGDDALQRDGDSHEWCLFSIEVRNTYGLPFEVTFDRTQQDFCHIYILRLMRFSPLNRMLLPIRRFRLSDDVISRRTPILSDRQFVVSKSSLTDAEDKIQRELFWYREELLHIIHARWKEANGSRHGDLSLRQQCMTMHMLNALKTDLTRIDVSLAQRCPEEPAVTLSGGTFIVASNTVVSMVAKITNTGRMSIEPHVFIYIHVDHTSASPLAMMLDVSTSPEEQVLLQGSLTDIALGRVESGQSRIVEVPLCFLSVGYFEIAVEARQLGVAGEKRRTGVARLWARVKEDDSLRTTSSDLE